MDAAGITSGIMKNYGVAGSENKDKTQLNKDAFLNLLVTQMQHQDPLEPTKNEDFLAQMAQFSALEQMKNLNTGFKMQQGNDLIGKTVVGKIVDEKSGDTKYVSGEVSGTKIKSGEVFLVVDDKDIELSKVEGVLKSKEKENVNKDVLEAIKSSLESINEKLGKMVEQKAEKQKNNDVKEGNKDEVELV